MIEKGHLSQSVWLDFRLRLLDRIFLPPVYKVCAYNSKHRPALTIYRHGVRAKLSEVLSSTISERLTLMDLSSLDSSSLSIVFKFGWGLDGSGDHSDFHQLTKRHFSTKSIMSVCVSVKRQEWQGGQLDQLFCRVKQTSKCASSCTFPIQGEQGADGRICPPGGARNRGD